MLRPLPPTAFYAWLAALVLVAGCGGDGTPSAAPELLAPAAAGEPAPGTTSTTMAPLPTVPAAAAHALVVEGARPTPSSLTLPAGASGVVTLDNRDDAAYEAEIGTPEPFTLELPAGAATAVDFGAHPPGRYRVTIRIGNGSATATVDTTAVGGGDLLCRAAAAIEPADRRLAAAADRVAAGLTAPDPAGFLAQFRGLATAEVPRLARAAGELEEAWRDVAAALPEPARTDSLTVADWLSALSGEASGAGWPSEVAGPWRAGADVAAPSASAAAAAVAAECAAPPPVPAGLPGGRPVLLLAVLDGPAGFVAPPTDVTAARYDVEQSSLPHATFVHQRTEYEAPGRVRAEVEWTFSAERRAVEEVVVTGTRVHARWAGQGWRDVTLDDDTSLAPVRADRTDPFGALLDALYTAANAVSPEEHDVRGRPALRFDLPAGDELEEALLGRLVPWETRAGSRVGAGALWVDPATGFPRRAAVTLHTPGYPDGLELTWEFRSFGEPPAPIAAPRLGDPAPAGFTAYRDRHGGWQAPVSDHWVPLEPVEPGLTVFVAPSATVEVFPDAYAWDGVLDDYEQFLFGLYGEPLARKRSSTQLGSLRAERADLVFGGATGREWWTVIHASDGEQGYWVVAIAQAPDPDLDRELDEMVAGFELVGTAI